MHVVTYTLSSLSRRIRCCRRRYPEQYTCRARTAAHTPAHTCYRWSCACSPGSTRSLSALSRSSEMKKKEGLVTNVADIRDVYPGNEFFPSRIRIPNSNFFHPGSWIPDPESWIPDPGSWIPDPGSRIKEFKYFNPKNSF
jgi:hypothetical protein